MWAIQHKLCFDSINHIYTTCFSVVSLTARMLHGLKTIRFDWDYSGWTLHVPGIYVHFLWVFPYSPAVQSCRSGESEILNCPQDYVYLCLTLQDVPAPHDPTEGLGCGKWMDNCISTTRSCNIQLVALSLISKHKYGM